MTGERRPILQRICTTLTAFHRDRRASSAVEFSIVSLPFIMILLVIFQMGIYYMAQSALNAGVIQTADQLVNTFYSSTGTPVIPNLNALVAAKSGALITNTPTTLYVELQPLANLSATAVPVSNVVIGCPSQSRGVLSLRAQATVTGFVPGLASLLIIRSSALLRCQGT